MYSTISATTTTSGTLHNGPVCSTCGARYLGSHSCSHADIVRRINELLALLDRPHEARNGRVIGMTNGCPCRPENGGSGVCGCTLGGPQVTY